MRSSTSTLTVACLCCFLTTALADELVKQETGVQQVHEQYGYSGAGTIVAIIDRGIDYSHPDFLNEDGTTRILAIFDVTDPAGAEDPDNPYGIGTLYTEAQINEALLSGSPLATRDAVGHGTATAGVAAGNGRASDGVIQGMAPEARIIAVKFTTEGAPAHGDQPAEAPFYEAAFLEQAIQFVKDVAEEAGLPVVMLANFGSSGGPMDGSSRLARLIDEEFGPGYPGVVFVSGSSDDGGVDNHAAATVLQGQTLNLSINKATAVLRLNLWYDGMDEIDVSITTPTQVMPLSSPQSASDRITVTDPEFTYYHNGDEADFWGAENDKNEILMDLNGPLGTYTLALTGSQIVNGQIQASLNPSNIFSEEQSLNRFLTHAVPGHTIWDVGSAINNVTPNSYVLRPVWEDIDGEIRTSAGNEVGEGALWTGSGIGPTYDGRTGITVSAPGNQVLTTYGQSSYWNTLRFNKVAEGDGYYGTLGAVSGAAPVLTGVIALMLEASPTLNSRQVARVLEMTAKSDSFTGDVPNVEWGYGKVDAFSALSMIEYGASFADDIMRLPVVRVGNIFYSVDLRLTDFNTLEFELASAAPIPDPMTDATAYVQGSRIIVPYIAVGDARYQAAFSIVSENPFRFQITSAEEY